MANNSPISAADELVAINWLDLSAVGIYLARVRLNGIVEPKLILSDTQNRLSATELTKAQFVKSDYGQLNRNSQLFDFIYEFSGTANNLSIRQLLTDLNIPDKYARVISTTHAQAYEQLSKASNNLAKQKLKAEMGASTKIGINADADAVYMSRYGRFILKNGADISSFTSKDIISEQRSGNLPKWQFLRSDSLDDLAKCCDGFVKHAHETKLIISNDDVRNFLRIIHSGNDSTDLKKEIEPLKIYQFQELLEISYMKMVHGMGGVDQHAFNTALSLYTNQPVRRHLSTDTLAYQQYSTPLPMAIIAQRLLIGDDTSDGKVVLDPTIGNGALVSQLKHLDVVGIEVDGKRVKNLASSNLPNLMLHENNAVTTNFISFNKGQPYDYTIVNPPFDTLPTELKAAKIGYQLNGKPDDNFYKTNKLDHYLIIKALNSRKPDGRSVFIIGGDSYLRPGEISAGRSQQLFNYLYDHYEVEAATEISGRLYARQGASFNVRMLIVGDRKDMPQEFKDVPERLNVIESYEELRAWSDIILENRIKARATVEQTNKVEHTSDPQIINTKPDLESLNEDVTFDFSELVQNTPIQNPTFDEDEFGASLEENANEVFSHSSEEELVDIFSENIGFDDPDSHETSLPEQQSLLVDSPIEKEQTSDQTRLENPEDLVTGKDNQGEENVSYQERYLPASLISDATTMIPSNQAGPFYKARDTTVQLIEMMLDESPQNRLFDHAFKSIREHFPSSIDAFVAYKLHYHDVKHLAKAFCAEQVDLLAMAINSSENGRAMLMADQTGLGKGRVNAGMIRYARLQGLTPVFMTKNAQLFNDIWRDLMAIDEAHHFKNPFIFNGNGHISEVGSEKPLFKPKPLKQGESTIPYDHDIVFASYSQFSRVGSKTETLKNSIDHRHYLILDESHLAASGKSNMGTILMDTMHHAHSTFFSSATGIKTAQMYRFYSPIFPESLQASFNQLEQLATDDVLEAVSTNLVSDGVMGRREHDLSRLTFSTKSPSPVGLETNQHLADLLSKILSDMSILSQDVKKSVNTINLDIEANIKAYAGRESQVQEQRLQATSMNFGSRMHQINRQFLLAIKTYDAVDVAIDCLKNHQKPVICMENTGESLLHAVLAYRYGWNDLDQDIQTLKEELEKQEEGKKNSAQVSRLNELIFQRNQLIATAKSNIDQPPLFKDLLEVMLDRLDTITVKGRYGSTYKERITDLDYLRAKESLKTIIEQFPAVPLMPLDILKAEIERQGFTVGEICGRNEFLTRTVNDNGDIHWRLDTKEDNSPSYRSKLCYQFQLGDIDAMMLTRSGSTGISLHSEIIPGERSDHLRQRHLIVLQAPQDIVDFIQLLGRVDRRGEFSAPLITLLDSGIPAETKVNMMHCAKLRRLSANVTSNRDSAATKDNDIDLINDIGDKIAFDYLIENPRVAYALDISIPEKVDEDFERQYQNQYINKLLSRIILLPVNHQKQLLSLLSDRFKDLVAELDEQGINPFSVQVYDWKAQTVDMATVDGNPLDAPPTNKFGALQQSAFDFPVQIKQLSFVEQSKPITVEEIGQLSAQQSIKLKDNLIRHLTSIGLEVNQSQTLDKLVQAYTSAYEIRMLEEFKKMFFDYMAAKERKIDPEILNTVNDPNISLDHLETAFNNAEAKVLTSSLRRVIEATHFLGNMARLISNHDLNHVVDIPDRNLFNSRGVLVGIELPAIKSDSHKLGQFKLNVVYPRQEKHSTISLSYAIKHLPTLIEQYFPAQSFRHERNTGDSLKSEFEAVTSKEIKRHVQVLSGNYLKALIALKNAGQPARSILYTNDQGHRERAIFSSIGSNVSSLEKAIKGLVTPKQMNAYLANFLNIYAMHDDSLPQLSFPTIKLKGKGVQIELKRLHEEKYLLFIRGQKRNLKPYSHDKTLFTDSGFNLDGMLKKATGSGHVIENQINVRQLAKLVEHFNSNYEVIGYISNFDDKAVEATRSQLANEKQNQHQQTRGINSQTRASQFSQMSF